MPDYQEILNNPPPPRMTEADFVAWTKNDTAAEWVGGDVVVKPPVDADEDQIRSLIGTVLQIAVQERRLGRVFGPRFTTRMTLSTMVVRRDPDVMFVGNERLQNLQQVRLEGPADLVVEVVSPNSEFRDFNQKFCEYEEAGVGEYWIVSPMSKRIYLFTLDAKTNRFASVDPDAEGRFRSRVLEGVWFHPTDLFAEERPLAADLLNRIDPTLLKSRSTE